MGKSLTEWGRNWNSDPAEPAVQKFADWGEKFLSNTNLAERARMVPEGLVLARNRGRAVASLIERNPERVFALAVPDWIRRSLPEAVSGLLEKEVGGRGELALFGALPEPGKEGKVPSNFRVATLGNHSYRAYVYGRRRAQTTLRDVPLQGVALGNAMAVFEYPARLLEAKEAARLRATLTVEPHCPISGRPSATSGQETILEVGNEPVFFCGPDHAAEYVTRLMAAEEEQGLDFGTGGGTGGGSAAGTSRTEGPKRLILLRVDFDDLPGAPFSDQTGLNLITNLQRYFEGASYGRTTIRLPGGLEGDRSDLTPTLRMPRSASYYGTNDLYAQLRSDALVAAGALGFDAGHYDFDMVCLGRVPGFTWSGLGYIGSNGAWIRNTSSTGTAAHELGHNFGLNHANFWDTAGRSVIGPGQSVEYGDLFDTMGSGGEERVFNTRYKRLLNWLRPQEMIEVITNGTYRLYAHDEGLQTGLIRALEIPGNNGTNYWLEFRRRMTGNPWLLDGAQLRWGFSGNQKTLLLDTTPGSAFGRDDSTLLIGQTYSDASLGLHVTVLGKGGTDPESLDLLVNRGAYLGNQSPSLELIAATTNAAVDEPVLFHAAAADPDGDALAFFWDFGNAAFGTNGPEQSYAWPAPGEYLLRCTVSDMKGGQASRFVVVRVGTPSTFRISGRVTTENQIPVEGARVLADSDYTTLTDSDGRYQLVGLPAGNYTLDAVLDGYDLTHPDFVNPVAVGPNAVERDFLAVAEAGRTRVPLIPMGSLWRYLDDGSDQGEAWREPEFEDGPWKEGRAQLGYGDGDETTVIGFGNDPNRKFLTSYFRHTFFVEDPADWADLTLGLLRDDGAVVYLNGIEIVRDNMPEGPIYYDTTALRTVGGTEEWTYFQSDLPSFLLLPGPNVLAVELHQQSDGSSDASFDLFLNGLSITNLPRGVFLASPMGQADLVAPADVLLNAVAWGGPESAITNVAFFEGANLLGESCHPPYSMVWSNVPFGRYTLQARAWDDRGLTLTSAPVNLEVQTLLIARGSVWNYLDTGVDPGPAWSGLNFDDTDWRSGPAQLGYGDGDEATVVSFGPNPSAKFTTTYFRRAFPVPDASEVANLTIRLLRDDGAVVYLNGIELYRSNMPQTGPILFSTFASSSTGKPEETLYQETRVPAGSLVDGVNVLAVEVHQQSLSSSDLSFDLELLGNAPVSGPPPKLDYVWDGTQCILFWPASNEGWDLYTAPNATGPWSPFEGEIGLTKSMRFVSIMPTAPSRFFQLRLP
jgi:Carboxypeptidase regulatory-like domain/PKD domain/Peptidase M66